jgi:hypothetical protein
MALRHSWTLALGLGFGTFGIATEAAAQAAGPTVIPVPFSQINPALPHPAHENARVTLKAIVRNAPCAGGYRVAWDVNLNNNFDDDVTRLVTPVGGTLYDIGSTFQVPVVPQDTRMPVGVRVRSTCANEPDAFGTFRLFVYDFDPNPDARTWAQTPDQLTIMGQMAIQETLWFSHRASTNRAGQGTAGVRAQYGSFNYVINGPGIWLFTNNGHQPAYPPGTINTFNVPLPNGWAAANDARWNTDPYAETALAFVNGALNAGTSTVAIAAGAVAAEEANTCGFNANGTERMCNRVPGTAAAAGAYTGGNSNNVYAQGMLLGGMATVLPALAATRLQVGGLAGRTWESFIQDMTDYLGYMQFDGGCALGGWLYTAANGASACGNSDGSTSQWAYIGLESAEVNGAPFGVFVNNRHKYRIASNLVNNQTGTGGSSYRSGGSDNFQLTGGAFVGARWLGVHMFQRGDNTAAFPTYAINYVNNAAYTRDRLRQAYDNYIAFTAAAWTSNSRYATSVGWHDRLWQDGDYLCSNPVGLYNAGRCGNTYAMYSHQKGYRTGSPELASVGGRDWFTQFTTYFMRAQDRNLGDYANFGRVTDAFCAGHTQVTCSYGAPWMSTGFGGLTVTPSLFTPKPVAMPVVQPTTVTEGCIGANSGLVTFSHAESFHPSPSSRILAYRWDFDASNGLWWDDPNAVPDWQTQDVSESLQYRYQRAGVYTATLQVVDNNNPVLSNAKTVRITVNAAPNVGPAAAAGGPYIVEIGQPLQLAGNASDQNAGCGDTILTAWDVNNTGTFTFANATNTLVPWNSMRNLPVGQPVPLRIRVRDSAGLESTSDTTITIYPAEPVAVATALPNPAACGSPITFDASRSYHPNPQRTISTYQWDVDGVPGFDGGGALPRFTYTYNRFGNYNVLLRVTDDLGRRHEVTLQVQVNQGNAPPVARTSVANYVVLEGDPLPLDGRPSSDANANCGDAIASYEWDLNNNGRFNDAGVDLAGANPVVAWGTVTNLFRWPADRNTGLPTNVITLRVTDTFGQTATVNANVTVYRAMPTAVIVQTPRPTPISLRDGSSTATLDGRESTSPIPGMTIVRYDWDLDNNGTFERANTPVVDFQRQFAPIPGPGNIPAVTVCLRVTDRDGRTASTCYQVQYRVPPTPPTADADPTAPPERAYHILLGDGVALDASASFDPDTAEFQDFLQRYRWDLNADVARPVWDRDIADANGDGREAILNLTAQELAALGINRAGAFPVLLEVEDTTSLASRDTTVLNVYARNPVASATANPNPAACGARITLDGSASDHPHPDINVVSWNWDTDGDGQYDDETGRVVVHQFDQFTFNNPLQVGLQVTDTNGNRGTVVVPVNINQGNRPPVANPGGPYVIALNDTLGLDARGSVEPDAACGDNIVRYDWDIRNDGSFEFSAANGAQQAVTWQQLVNAGVGALGQYDVRLRVTDRFGVSAEALAQLRVVRGPAAVGQAVPNAVGCNQAVTFDASGSSTDGPVNAGFALTTYEWDFDGNGTYDGQGVRVVHNMVGRGLVNVGLRVTDASGRTSTAVIPVTVNINNLAPVADPAGPYFTGRVGAGWAAVRLDGRASFDPNQPCDQVVEYRWDVDRNGTTDFQGPTVNYTNPGWQVGTVQIVRLTVCDTYGICSAPVETEIRVQLEAPPSGEVVSPRANAGMCIPAGNVNVDFRVSDPEGEPVTAIVLIGGVEMGRTVVQTRVDGQPVNGTVVVNAALVPDGARDVVIRFEDNAGAFSTANAGGRITFDKTPPQVMIGALPQANACFNPAAIPATQYQASDNIDQTLSIDEGVVANGCGRTVTVRAMDDCGNVAEASRGYRVAEAVQVDIQGAQEGQLVASPRLTWSVVGPADCANAITATLSRDGAAAAPYAANTQIVLPGSYVLALSIVNCQGVARQQTRNFVVNAPPVAVPVPAVHPNRDPAIAAPGGYLVAEGGDLVIDGRESRTPEAIDSIALYEWDFTGDGTYDARGATVPFPTQDNGRFQAQLRVTDSLGATHTSGFTVTVTDVNPIANPGGPYTVAQGADLRVDASGSQSGSQADLIRTYSWDWGDGTPPSAPSPQPTATHRWAESGLYNVRLTVADEDSEATAVVVVNVTDVDPVVDELVVPPEPYEIAEMPFTLRAHGGAAGEPITRVEWDFNGDGVAEFAGPALFSVMPTFRDAGPRTVTIRIRDKDSVAVISTDFVVREITLGEIAQLADTRSTALLAQPGWQPSMIDRLRVIQTWGRTGAWGERNGHPANVWVGLDNVLTYLPTAQSRGADYGNLLWAMSRQFLRDVRALKDRIVDVDQAQPANHPLILRSDTFMRAAEAFFNQPNFEADISGRNNPFMAGDLFLSAYEAYFYLRQSVDPFNRFNDFAMPFVIDPGQRIAAANDVNADLITALNELRQTLVEYRDHARNPQDLGPGGAEVAAAIPVLDHIIELTSMPLALSCPDGSCINDEEALENELALMDLIDILYSSKAVGVYVRDWQHGLMLAVKFRIEISLVRVEAACGKFSPVALNARSTQAEGLDYVANYDYDGALGYYTSPDTRCLILETYNNCLVPANRGAFQPAVYPAECVNVAN